ncbi:hypothetical protein ASD24_22300 [Paenibacillus sp. Root52]|uniref:hypothetical protein n=1 Tax=Paenibacillus sp. Root52 TaxID=1736552 RepID=UPI0006F2F3FF|nr:hypothetical protein [Paenibacillus sp. Root52]KQY92042.1 hypothetical protein ASD24_22300 [Paenibacillus sp. Root52]
MDYQKMIQLYGIDMEDELEVSPFEYLDTFGMRSDLHRNRDKLEQTDLQLLHKYDQMLLNRSEELYNYMKPVYSFNDTSKPIEEWWWHLDRVVTGELLVDVSIEI